MGEHATYNGETIKIGTCEDMYYLRADQRHLIEGYDFLEDDGVFRFRFPFPDEDGVKPGQFGDHNRGTRIPGWELPADFEEHGMVQFRAESAGYNVCLPCPEQFGERGMSVDMPDGLRVHRNGFNGGPVVRQQKIVDGETLTIVACGACGAAWRLSLENAAKVAEAFLNESERQECGRDGWAPANSDRQRGFLHAMAERVLAGYQATSTKEGS